MMTPEKLLETLEELKADQFKDFKWYLCQKNIVEGYQPIKVFRLEGAERTDTVDLMVNTYKLQGALMVTKKVLEKIGRNDLVQSLSETSSGPEVSAEVQDVRPTSENREGNIQKCQAELKSYLETKTKNLCQGTKEAGSSTPLNKIYTELYITEGDSGEVNSQHEVIELECRRSSSEEKIDLNDIFEPLSNEEICPQKVLTKGIAGIGKTVAVQKFTHDWAAGNANKTTQFIFPFTFRELNLIKDKRWSLKALICYYFEEVKDLETSDLNNSSILFIFDGLDESKLPLDFKNNKLCRSVTDTTTLDVLLTNLITGKLLHRASVWITSRPGAATKIPSNFITG